MSCRNFVSFYSAPFKVRLVLGRGVVLPSSGLLPLNGDQQSGSIGLMWTSGAASRVQVESHVQCSLPSLKLGSR
jgi:hypothetical protein